MPGVELKPGDEVVLSRRDMGRLAPFIVPIMVLESSPSRRACAGAIDVLRTGLSSRLERMLPDLARLTWELTPSTRTITILEDLA